MKHACLGGVYAMKAVSRYLALDGARYRIAIVVCADIAEYERGSSGEQTQGRGRRDTSRTARAWPARRVVASSPAAWDLSHRNRTVRYSPNMWGLNDTHIAHVNAAPLVNFGHDKMDLGYVLSAKPDYAYVFGLEPVPMAVPGYDFCWPSAFFPVTVYRRNFSLAPNERALAASESHPRRLAPPPACRPPGPRTLAFAPPPPIR